MPTKIAWTDESWNPVTGCTKVSTGCAHCYIERTPPMRMAGQWFTPLPTGGAGIPVILHPDRLEMPLHWRKPRRVFVCSMGDLFHEDIPTEFIDSVFAVMALAGQHTFQVLTKRPERMRSYLLQADREPKHGAGTRLSIALQALDISVEALNTNPKSELGDELEIGDGGMVDWPLPNVWLGVSVENQKAADERVPILLETPAAVRFVSAEPLLGPLNLWRPLNIYEHDGPPCCTEKTGWHSKDVRSQLDWVIVGGESGGPPERRLVERLVLRDVRVAGEPVNDIAGWIPKRHALEWVRDIREQCQEAGVPFWFKGWGGSTPNSGGHLLDGREWQEMPSG